MPEEVSQSKEFSAEDLALVSGEAPMDDDGGGAEDLSGQEAKPKPEGKGDDGKAVEERPNGKAKTIATGADAEEEAKAKEEEAEKAHKPYWPDNWRQKLAEHIAAGDQKAYKRELKRLERIADPSGIYGMYREIEGKLTSGGLVKIPGKDAKPEERQEFLKAIGVPEKPEEYFDKIQLENGAVIGEADKPLVDTFAQAVHKAGATPEVMSAALNWYYQHQEQQAAEIDEADAEFLSESERALKEEWGPSFKRRTNAIASVFATAPGGADASNPNSLYARLVSARDPEGRLLGNDPDFIRWLDSIRNEINPAATVVEDGDQSGQSIAAELEKLRDLRRTDKRRYYSEEVQQREQELIAARDKIQARNRA